MNDVKSYIKDQFLVLVSQLGDTTRKISNLESLKSELESEIKALEKFNKDVDDKIKAAEQKAQAIALSNVGVQSGTAE